jgi:hypothetical protein
MSGVPAQATRRTRRAQHLSKGEHGERLGANAQSYIRFRICSWVHRVLGILNSLTAVPTNCVYKLTRKARLLHFF